MRYAAFFLTHVSLHARAYYNTSILIGEIDEERDNSIDLSTIRADPIPPIRY